MKECPVCHAKAFDDAKMCYGCLHRFDEEAAHVEIPETRELKTDTPPVFSIRFTPETKESGDVVWNCAVEVA